MKNKRGRRPENRHEWLFAASRPSTYIWRFETIQPGDKVVLWLRVSSGSQNTNGNNDDQEAKLRAAVEARGGIVVGVRICSRNVRDAEAELYEAANFAVQNGAVLLAESTSRFARSYRYHPKERPHLVAGADELRDLRFVCGDVTLVTLLDPDAKGSEERSFQTKRGQMQKGKPGGRPTKPRPGYKKRRRLQALSKVRWMMWVGMSNRAIARALKTNERNVRRWGAAFLRYDKTDERA